MIMKKTILLLSIAAFCFSCGNGTDGKTAEAKKDDPDIEKGLKLYGSLDCSGCHKITEASIGPAYNQIGQKYENTDANINFLAEKIQKGGSGNWGTVPMAGHPNVSTDDARLLAKYVLSLKNEK
jgi:cytochrome c